MTGKQQIVEYYNQLCAKYKRTQAVFNGTTYTGNPDAVQRYRQQQVQSQIAEIIPLALRLYKLGLINL